MRPIGALLWAFTALASLPCTASAQLPKPTFGWNLGNTMEATSGVGTWGGLPTQALIKAVAKAGFNTVRIPCAWDTHANQTTYAINPTYMGQVKQVVDWCMAANLYVVINDHWDGGWFENNITDMENAEINSKVKSYWKQIATEFASYNNHLLFAAANEPAVSTAAQMSVLSTYYQTFVNEVRGRGGNNASRWLVVQGPSADIDTTNSLMTKLPKDPTSNRLMVEIHFYTPYQFTLMPSDQSWGSMFYFWGQGYHSSTDTSRNATWGEETYLDGEFQKMYNQFISAGIPVMLGEFRAEPRSSLGSTEFSLNNASTTYWDRYALESAQCHGLAPVCWDTPGQMLNWTTGATEDRDALKALTGGAALPPPHGDGAQYCFELGTQNFAVGGAQIASVATSTAEKVAGSQSLVLKFAAASAGTSSVSVSSPSIPAGKTVTFHLWIPSGTKLSSVQPYIQDHNWAWFGAWSSIGSLTLNRWNTIQVTVPATAITPMQVLGVQFTSSAAWKGTCYIDSVGW